jgi:alpha,alpha-trehalase
MSSSRILRHIGSQSSAPVGRAARACRLTGIRLCLIALVLLGACGVPRPQLPTPDLLAKVQGYIHAAWTTLTRSTRDLPQAAPDPKLPHERGQPWPVYIASDDFDRTQRRITASLDPAAIANLDLRPLPPDPAGIREHGLVYLPNPYVVPGGRFNEMYGWDSYFIELGLLRDDRVDLPRGMVDNAIYEVQHFGKILNANRTYYLQRSQPPFLTRMILALFNRTGDRVWLRSTVPAIERYCRFWTSPPHLVPSIGLSRYYALGEGPAPEVVYGERDASGRNHYDKVREFYRTHRVTEYDVRLYYDRARDQLTPLFYKGDRSMRESGFDPSDRFGPFGADIINYAPVCLNSLLYMMEADAAEIARMLADEQAYARWLERARARHQAIDRYLWDEKTGLYLDYDVATGRRRNYPFATTFYPLWAGLASVHQAEKVHMNLGRFEAPGGLLTSTRTSGSQWDAPFGWAPLQMIAVAGLRSRGYTADADRLGSKFLSVVVGEFARTGTIAEKYDVQHFRTAATRDLRFGYSSNEVGFGWTNAAVLDLLAALQTDAAQ